MTTLELPWLELYLGNTHFYAERRDPGSYVLQWHTAACTLYIVGKDHHEIDLRVEREIYEIKYEKVVIPRGEDTKTRVISLRMHASRPVKWAKDTYFVPGFTDHGLVTIKINIGDASGLAIYEQLTGWLERTAFTGATQSMSPKDAQMLWRYVTRVIIHVENGPDLPEANPFVYRSSWGCLRQHDIDCLRPGEWANDEIIAFGMKLFLSFIEGDDAMENLNLHLFDTFFFEKLCKEGPAGASSHTKRVNIFEKDILVYPIHKSSHWFLIIVDKIGTALDDENSTSGSEGEPELLTDDPKEKKEHASIGKAKMYILDSYPSEAAKTAIANILLHLRFEASKKLGKVLDPTKIKQYIAKVPRQPNLCDCGFYLLHFFRLFLNYPDKYRRIIKSGKKEDAQKNWAGSEVGRLRGDLLNFIKSTEDE